MCPMQEVNIENEPRCFIRSRRYRQRPIISRYQRTLALCTLLVALVPHVEVQATDRTAGGDLPPWNARPSVLVDAQERIFRNGTVTLSGTLYTPRSGGRVPAVIALHAASSPARDNPLYRHLIEMLPPMKIAIFVFDRRGSGRSGGKLEDSDYALLADDGIAAQRMLAQDPRIDSQRIGFWGLSQGGWLSLLAASRSPQAAFAVSISAPMTTPDVQMNFAVANILRIKGYSPTDIDQAIAARTAVDDYLRGKRDRATAQEVLDAASAKPWFEHIYMGKTFKDPDQSRWAKEMRHDPLAVLDTVKQPALVIYGSADPWVPVQISAERLRATSAQHPNIEVAVIAGADHAMATSVPVADQIDPVLSAREAPDAAEYLGLLGSWLARQGLVSPR
jgi:pimeloyl-ACP methyl ester carboxylesterase